MMLRGAAISMQDPAYHFAPNERPSTPGGPFSPRHSSRRRLGYFGVALLIGVITTLGNALVNVNIASLSGELGMYTAQASVLPAVFVAMNASGNLILIKARAQFGIPEVTHSLLIAYIAAGLCQFVFPGFASAVLIRAVCGITAAALITLTTYNLIQVFPVQHRARALVVGVSLAQLGTPIARLIPVDMLALDHWRGLHLMEIGLALAALAATYALPLPPSERVKTFEPLDVVTIALVVPAMLLLCVVISEGRILWWIDTPWLGWALVAAAPLLAAAISIEYHRPRPLLHLEWLGSRDILRFAGVALFVRLALAEQTYGAVGLLTFAGLNNDQLHTLFALVLLGMLLGMVTSATILTEQRLPYLVMVAAMVIAVGAWMDSNVDNLTRPEQLYWSQFLIGFGTTLFVGPALVFGIIRMFKRGTDHMVSFIVLFSSTQNVGGLIGASLLGSYQITSVRAHLGALSEHLVGADPGVAARIQSGSSAVAGTVIDPAIRALQGSNLLGLAMNREATILAFNDVFQLVALLGLMIALYIAYVILVNAWRRRRALPEAPA
jgi:Major Facilitator Superfamily